MTKTELMETYTAEQLADKYLRLQERFNRYTEVIKGASKQIPCGIYAVEKEGICELRKDTFDSKEELKKSVAEYAAKGFKVHYNS